MIVVRGLFYVPTVIFTLYKPYLQSIKGDTIISVVIFSLRRKQWIHHNEHEFRTGFNFPEYSFLALGPVGAVMTLSYLKRVRSHHSS